MDRFASNIRPTRPYRRASLRALRDDKRGFVKTGISWLDVKLGTRMLFKYPGLTLIGGLGMAVAIAIGAGFFNLTAALMDYELPLHESDRLVAIQNWDAEASGQERQILHDFLAWRQELKSVRELGAYHNIRRNLIVPDQQPEQVAVAQMSASGFGVARVKPLVGRHLVEEDERPGAPLVIVLGADVWRTRFRSDPSIIGREVRLGNEVHTVVGVMPEEFAFPLDHRFWVPLRYDAADYARGDGPTISVFGRLAPGVSMEQAQTELEAYGRRAAAAYPQTHAKLRPQVIPYARGNDFSDDLVAWQMQIARILVSLLLVVVCVNVAILVYARTATRSGEIAVRSALGASRRRIVAQLFVEALVLSAVSAVAGLVFARLALDRLATLLPAPGSGTYPYWVDFGLSASTVAYTAALVVLAALIVGVLPAMQATGRRLQSGLRHLGGGTGMRLGRTWTVLIVAQVAFAVAVLPLAMFSAWDWMRFGLAEPGFAANEFLTAPVGMDYETPPSAEADAYEAAFDARFAARLGELSTRLRAEPGTADLALSSNVPGQEPVVWVEVEGLAMPSSIRDPDAVKEGAAGHQVRMGHVDAGFFETFEVPVLAGRRFAAADMDTASAAVVVNRSFVQTVLGGGSALGRRVRYVGRGGDAAQDQVQMARWYEIVGVVGDFPRQMEPGSNTEARVYHPMALGQVYPTSLSVRVRGSSPAQFAGTVRDIAASVDPTLRLGNARSLDAALRENQLLIRITALGIGLVTLSVLLLSAAGIYALMSFTVTQRRREIGIRTALGAHPRSILGSVFSRAARQLGTGVAIGLAVAALLISLSQGGEMVDDRAFVLLPVVAVLMTAVGLLAALGPARRGLRIQPMEALRDE